MNTLTRLASTFALSMSVSVASAQYPERPITMIVPFEAGGTTDIIGRIVADHLSTELGRAVVVENRSGSGGTVGTSIASRALPDGYTILLATTGTHSINPNLRKVPYDPVGDFAPISVAAETPVLIVVNPTTKINTLEDLAKTGKEHPDSLNFASAGIGSTAHLAGELFNELTGAKMTHIPYRGAGPAINDVIGGRVPVFMNNIPPLVAHVKAGTLRPLAVASPNRSSLLPDVPTSAEAGIPGLVVSGWFGILAPKGTPSAVVERLRMATASMQDSAKAKERLREVGAEVSVSASSEEFADYVSKELQNWKDIVKTANVKLD